jgi:hypothetical protein
LSGNISHQIETRQAAQTKRAGRGAPDRRVHELRAAADRCSSVVQYFHF